jgi:hypothetical protein
MTTNETTANHRPDAKSDAATEPSPASKTEPGLAVSHATSEPDLQSRIKVRRVELVARLRELREDTRVEAMEAGDKLKAKLAEIAHILKEGVVDGWATLGDGVKHQIERWLADSARPLPAQKLPARTPTRDLPTKIGQS